MHGFAVRTHVVVTGSKVLQKPQVCRIGPLLLALQMALFSQPGHEAGDKVDLLGCRGLGQGGLRGDGEQRESEAVRSQGFLLVGCEPGRDGAVGIEVGESDSKALGGQELRFIHAEFCSHTNGK